MSDEAAARTEVDLTEMPTMPADGGEKKKRGRPKGSTNAVRAGTASGSASDANQKTVTPAMRASALDMLSSVSTAIIGSANKALEVPGPDAELKEKWDRALFATAEHYGMLYHAGHPLLALIAVTGNIGMVYYIQRTEKAAQLSLPIPEGDGVAGD